jgi:hypothetical protein
VLLRALLSTSRKTLEAENNEFAILDAKLLWRVGDGTETGTSSSCRG